MRFKTLVLIPAIAVLISSDVPLPIAQSQTSANAPQATISQARGIEISSLATQEAKTIGDPLSKTSRASRSKTRTQLASSNVEANKAFAKSFMESEYSWGEEQYQCLVKLWDKESGWRHTADNPNSSAYGIPQALPGKKMSSAGADWKTNPETQIKWGLNYIDKGYNSPCGAWGKWKKKRWY